MGRGRIGRERRQGSPPVAQRRTAAVQARYGGGDHPPSPAHSAMETERHRLKVTLVHRLVVRLRNIISAGG